MNNVKLKHLNSGDLICLCKYKSYWFTPVYHTSRIEISQQQLFVVISCIKIFNKWNNTSSWKLTLNAGCHGNVFVVADEGSLLEDIIFRLNGSDS